MKEKLEKIPYGVYDLLSVISAVITIVSAVVAIANAGVEISKLETGQYVVSCNKILALLAIVSLIACL